MLGILAVFWAAAPYNPVAPPALKRIAIATFVHEGWGFFTRNPREPDVTLHGLVNGRWVQLSMGPISSARNLYGLNRAVRAQGAEFGLVAQQLGAPAWVECETEPIGCLRTAPYARGIQNASPSPTLCGTVGIVRQAPLPWAWREWSGLLTMPSSVAVLEVACENAG